MNLSLRMSEPAVLVRLRIGLRQRRRLHEAVGMRVQKLVRDHLLTYDADNPNQLGAPRSHYWLHAAFDASLPQSLELTETAATLFLCTPGMNRALHDVVIRPIKAKTLAIPVSAMAYHLSPREVPGLAPVFNSHGFAGLADGVLRIRQKDTKRGAKGTTFIGGNPDGLIWFWFSYGVKQYQDPSLLPDDDEIVQAACVGVRDFLKRHLTRS